MNNIAALRFLVVEDHGFQRWITGNILEGMGAKHIFSAPDGQAALDLLAGLAEPVDIVISDLDMPGMDGMEFIRNIGTLWKRTAVIVASSLDRSLVAGVEAMARAYGVTLLGAIEKPVTPKKLSALIALYHDRVQAIESPAASSFTAEEIAEGLRKNQFEAFFQPKVDLATRKLCGAETNARWRHPQQGLVLPKMFISSLESTGLIDDLTEIILKAAAVNCRAWLDAGVDASVSVNLSLVSLSDLKLADRMVSLVEGKGLEPRHVIFEVTESAAASDLARALENFSRLRMKGFGLSIDDYGTGYSSMERLARVPFTELKIDQSFVRNAPTQPASRAVLESSLEMAQKLDIVAVAEGVQSQEEWDLLGQLDCPMAQGYFIARPMDASGFRRWAGAREAVTG